MRTQVAGKAYITSSDDSKKEKKQWEIRDETLSNKLPFWRARCVSDTVTRAVLPQEEMQSGFPNLLDKTSVFCAITSWD